jgi:hypothetical protein
MRKKKTIRSEYMDQTITLQALLQCGAIIMGAWGFYKVIMEIVKNITARHDREQAWDKAVKDIEVDREALKSAFDERLDEQDAKIQQLVAMLCMSLRAESVILEALSENDIGNGEVKNMKKELNSFLTQQIGQ